MNFLISNPRFKNLNDLKIYIKENCENSYKEFLKEKGIEINNVNIEEKTDKYNNFYFDIISEKINYERLGILQFGIKNLQIKSINIESNEFVESKNKFKFKFYLSFILKYTYTLGTMWTLDNGYNSFPLYIKNETRPFIYYVILENKFYTESEFIKYLNDNNIKIN